MDQEVVLQAEAEGLQLHLLCQRRVHFTGLEVVLPEVLYEVG